MALIKEFFLSHKIPLGIFKFHIKIVILQPDLKPSASALKVFLIAFKLEIQFHKWPYIRLVLSNKLFFGSVFQDHLLFFFFRIVHKFLIQAPFKCVGRLGINPWFFSSGCYEWIQMCSQPNLMRNPDILNFQWLSQVTVELQTNSFDEP